MDHILKHQNFITVFLSVCLLGLIVVMILHPNIDLDGPFSIVTGWLGIVIGFFFNQQFAEQMKKKLIETEKKKKKVIFEAESLKEELKKEFMEEYAKMTRVYEDKIPELLKKNG